MLRVCIWYLTAESGLLDSETRLMIEHHGFLIKQPNNRNEFLLELDKISASKEDEIQIHIHAHGNMAMIAPYDDKDIERMRADGDEPNIEMDTIDYTDICPRIEVMVANGRKVILNMMAICNSFNTCLSATHFLGYDGPSNDFRDSWAVYPFNPQEYPKILETLNMKRFALAGNYKYR